MRPRVRDRISSPAGQDSPQTLPTRGSLGLDDRGRRPAAGRSRAQPDRSVPRTWRGCGNWRRPPPSPPRSGCRRRAKKPPTKFEHGRLMWVDPIAVEQATSEPVAAAQSRAIRSVRWSSTSARASAAMRCRWRLARDVLAVDLDQGMCRRIRYNAGVYESDDRDPCGPVAEPRRSRSRRSLAASRSGPAGARSAACAIARGLRTRDRPSGSDAFGRVAAGAIKLEPGQRLRKPLCRRRSTKSS